MIAASAKSKPRSANVFARLTGSKVTRMGYCSYKNNLAQGDEGPQRTCNPTNQANRRRADGA